MRRAVWKAAGALSALALATGSVAAQTPGQNPLAARPAPIVYVLDQLATGPLTPELIERMKPLTTLQQIEDLLKGRGIAFSWRRTEVSTEQIPPAVAQQIAALPPKEVFIASQGQGKGFVMSVVISRR
jgi:hypothetical protein